MNQPVLIVATALFLVTHAANLQVPLYNTYAQLAGYSSGLSAIAFATYVTGLLPTLVVLGGISERIGRKTVILASLLSASLATFLMIAHPTIYMLFVTRVLQGFAVGLITGTGTAYICALMPQNSAQVAAYVSLTTALGFSSGALFTNAALLFQESLVPFSYWTIFIGKVSQMNLWHRFPDCYLIGSLSVLGLVALDNPTIAVAEISEPSAHEGILSTNTELRLEISPTFKNAGDALEKIRQSELLGVGEASLCSFSDAIASCSEEGADELHPTAIPTATLETALEDIPQEPTLTFIIE